MTESTNTADDGVSRRVWFVTGASSGFGRAIAEAALSRGDAVVGTARRTESLEDLVGAAPEGRALGLDVTDEEQIGRAVEEATSRFGRVDVLVNNAGHGSVGAVEEFSMEQLRGVCETMFFGAVALTKAVLPVMRERRSGAIVQVSSFGGQVAYPGFGAYCVAKFALEGLSEALRAEVEPFGVEVLIVEPGAFRTGFGGGRMQRSREIEVYRVSVVATREAVDGMDGTQLGDPKKAARAILTALDAEATPLRLPLGADAVEGIRNKLDGVRAEIDAWEAVALDTALDAGGREEGASQ